MSRTAALGLIGALLLAGLAYGAALDGEFHLDDWTTIQANWRLRGPSRFLAEVRPADLLGPARHVTDATFALDFARAGATPAAFHLTSLLLHLVAAGLAFLLLRAVLLATLPGGAPARADGPAAAAAALFALHPLQSEVVAYAAQRSEVLAALLSLGALLALWRAAGQVAPLRAAAWSALAAALHLLALGAKATAVTVPAAFLLLRLVAAGPGAPSARVRLARALLVAAPCWVLSVASVARNLVELGPGSTAGLQAGLGPQGYLLTELGVHWRYLRLAVLPLGQTIDPPWREGGLTDPRTLAAGLGLAVLVAGAVVALVRTEGRTGSGAAGLRLAAGGLLWWFLELAPTSSLVPIDDPVAEHRTYLALLGLALAAAVGGGWLLTRWAPGRRAWGAVAVAAAGLALGGATAARAQVWRSDLALWREAVARNPASVRALVNQAYARQQAGDLAGAEADYQGALQRATLPRMVATIALNLSALHLDQGRPQQALEVAERALGLGSEGAGLLHNQATALRLLGRFPEALRSAEGALARMPGDPDLHDTLGLVHFALGDREAALTQFRSARTIEERAIYSIHEALVLGTLDRGTESCDAWRRAASFGPLEPRFAGAPRQLGCW